MKPLEKILSAGGTGLAPSAIRELLPYMRMDDMISLGGGYPNPDTFAIKKLICETVDGIDVTLKGASLSRALQYGPSTGEPELIEQLIEWHLQRDGVKLDAGRFVILNGSQEGLFAVGFLFLEREDSVLCSEPSYPGALASFRAFTNHFITVPVDSDGLQTEMAARILESMESAGKILPKFIYTVPTGHNPAGVNLSLERRKELLEIASRFGLLVIEDDPYRMISFDEEKPLPTLQSLDREGLVIRLDSFSKIFLPGFRIGYLTASREIAEKVVLFKQASNLHTTSLNQMILAQYFRRKGVSEFLERTREISEVYKKNRDALLDACVRYLPGWVDYDIPKAGMFVWFRLPSDMDAERLIAERILQDRVILVAGSAFSPSGGNKNCVRVSFGTGDEKTLTEGIKRFAGMLKTVKGNHL